MYSVNMLSKINCLRPFNDYGSNSKRRLNRTLKMCLIFFLVMASLSVILWITLQLVAHLVKKEETQELLKKIEALENKGIEYQSRVMSFQKIFEESAKGTNHSLNDFDLKLKTEADENKAKIEILEKVFHSSENQATKLQKQLEKLINVSDINSKTIVSLDNVTKINEAELWNGINVLKNKTDFINVEMMKELKEIQNRTNNSQEEVKRKLVDLNQTTSNSMDDLGFQLKIEIQKNTVKIENLEKQTNSSDIKKITDNIAFLQEKVSENIESLHSINHRLGNTTTFLALALQAGMLILSETGHDKCFSLAFQIYT